ncbi:MAG: GntR family transcriptional regulator [Pseudomonadota bacterium]
MYKDNPIGPIHKKILAEEIADSIRKRIFDGTFKPGEKLPPERELAKQLRVNRSSLREGLKLLQQLGLVSIRHGDGTRVLDFFQTASVEVVKYLLHDESLDRLKIFADILEVRTILCLKIVELAAKNSTKDEIRAVRQNVESMREPDSDESAAVNQDFEFYEMLARVADNMILTLILNTVKPPFKLFKLMFGGLAMPPGDVWNAQDGILDAIENKDRDKAVSIAGEYFAQTGSHFLHQLKKKKEKENEEKED